MSQPLRSDLITVLKGLECVIKEGIRLQDSRLKQIWLTSSIRSINEELYNISVKTGKQILNDPKILKNATQNFINESYSRSTSVFAGIKELSCYSSGREFPVPTKEDENDSGNVASSDTLNVPFKESFKESMKPKDEIKLAAGNLCDRNNVVLSHPEIKKDVVEDKNKSMSINTPLLIKPKINFPSEGVNVKPNEVVDETNGNRRETLYNKDTDPPIVVPIPPKVQQQQLSTKARQRPVPASRFARLISFGGLAAGLGFGTAAELARRTLGSSISERDESSKSVDSGKYVSSLFLTPANAERIVNTLCKVRGAALKIGQILSIQDNNIVSPELQSAFERVRQAADFMPTWQVQRVLNQEFGEGWESKVASFEETPFAAASIGQVHLATLHDGRQVAMKIQYPGVAQGIDSDIDNLVSILKVWKIFPDGMFIDNVVSVAKRELAWEVDYVREAECSKKFQDLLRPYPEYMVPTVIDELSKKQILTTELVQGVPVDKCIDLDRPTREHVCLLIMRLCLKELFEFYYMQTDPNWANFFYDTKTKKLALLDFGATRSYEKSFMDQYICVIKAAADGKRDDVLKISRDMGFLTGYESKAMEAAHVDAVMILGEVFGSGGFDFGSQNTTLRLQRLVPTIITERLCPPPEEIYSLHRKLSGVFLLCAKLQVNINCRDLFEEVWDSYQFD